MMSGKIAKLYGHAGLPEDTIHVKFTGNAGQSFGAWLARGVSFELMGDANDYVGKGLSGGRIAIYPSADSPLVPEENIIVGNTVLYGAIAGECYFEGVAGERFAVRNSGATPSSKGGRPWLRVHDGRHRGCARWYRAEFRSRYVAAALPCAQ